MKILVKFYQALTSNTVISILKERMFGWSVEDQSFIYKEADGSENGLTKYIPSIIGNGTNIKVVMEGHSLNKHDLVRLDLTGNYVNSISTLDNSQNATHYVFDVQGDDVYLAQHGSWKMISPKGKRYLSSSQSNTMTSAYTGVEQSVGVCDGTFFHVNFNENKTSQRYNKVLAIGSPMVGMDFTLLYTSKPTTIMKIKSVINGNNISSEAILPHSWYFQDKLDIVNLKNIHKKFGTKKLKNFPSLSLTKQYINSNLFSMFSISPLNLLDYNKEEAKELLIKEFDWKDYGGKHYESIFTRF
jgi:hypothetical protein